MKKGLNYIFISFIVIILIILFDYNCPFYNLLGIPCAGCGITRSFIALVNLDFHGVILHNAAIFMYIFIAIIYIFKVKYYKQLIAIAVLLIVIYYLLRLYMYYPNTYPMLMKEDTIIHKLYTYINLK